MQHQFGLIGVGFIAARHLRAIQETGGTLSAALDPHDSVGILDSYFPAVPFFVDSEKFWGYIAGLQGTAQAVSMMSICTPNDLHEENMRLAMQHGASVLCEKPAVVEPDALDRLQEVERLTKQKVSIVLQLRLHPKLQALKKIAAQGHHTVDLRYITPRGPWYDVSWKGDMQRSGGLAVNIGIHLFDALIWLFGTVQNVTIVRDSMRRLEGTLQLERATVNWFLSINSEDLRPEDHGRCRRMIVNGETIDFTGGFEDLHTEVYRHVLAGNGFSLEDARPAIETTARIRQLLSTKV